MFLHFVIIICVAIKVTKIKPTFLINLRQKNFREYWNILRKNCKLSFF